MKINKKYLVLASFLFLFVASASAATLGVSEVDYLQESSEFYDEGHVLVEFQADGTGETIVGSVPSSTVEQLAGQQPSKQVDIRVEDISTRAEYEIDDRGNFPLRSIDLRVFDFDTKSARQEFIDSGQECIDPDRDGSVESRTFKTGLPLFETYHHACFTTDFSDPVYNIGFIEDPDQLFNAKFVAEFSDGTEESVVLSNDGSGAGKSERLSNVQFEFIGLADTGTDPDDSDNTLAAYSSATGWKLIDQNDFEEYETFMETTDWESELENGIEDFLLKENPGAEIEAEINDKYSIASDTYTESGLFGDASFKFDGEEGLIENGILTHQPTATLQWFRPEFLVRINGEFIGLEKQFADPVIESVEKNPEVTGLGDGTLEVKVTNKGGGQGTFDFEVDTPQGFEVVGVSQSRIFDPGETKTMFATISADGSDELSGTGTFTVEDRETQKSDSIQFDASFTPAQECEPGNRDAVVNDEGNWEIVECGENGVDLNTVKTCDEGEIAEPSSANNYECVDPDGPGPGGGGGDGSGCGLNPLCYINNVLDNRFGGGPGLGIFGTIDIVVSLIAGIVGFGFFAQNLSDFAAPTISSATRLPEATARLLLGVLGFILVFYLAFVLISSIFVKLLIVVALAAYVYIQGLIPGV